MDSSGSDRELEEVVSEHSNRLIEDLTDPRLGQSAAGRNFG